ncbi:error-prone DNA polymerase [Cyclobacterium sp.]|uniref:error-prone DNA polymerase n=1 Tax=Cyclobacterium sp. TaxID=1966343 RepID=UPI0019CE8B14|nr:error-prone DNA polymerase [Cyclobacterium sp.]MBD3629999.1 error-prone DNA polymerase [Cyclobacterium sp.]
MQTTAYSELQVTSNFSFLRGGSHPEELVQQAIELGYEALALTDRNTLAGIVRAHKAARESGLRFIPACRLDLLDGPSLLAYPRDREAYGRLSSLLSLGNLRAEKGICHLYKADVYAHARDSVFIAVPPTSLNAHLDFEPSFYSSLEEYREAIGDNLYLAAAFTYNGSDQKRLFRIAQWEKSLGIPMVAVNDVHYHVPGRRALQDVLTCIREKCTIQSAGFRLHPNAERYLKSREEMHRLFREYPAALRRAEEITDSCQFSLDQLTYQYPEEISSEGRSTQEELELRTWEGARSSFGEQLSETLKNTIQQELEFIARKEYASYFLTVYDLVRFARKRGILCQGRGSAANSVVCYCLGITSVDPSKFKLLFARFMSDARNEPPDIDVDFEHERREEVMQYIYEKYGRDRAGIVATVTRLHWKGAVRDVGKAMGLSLDAVDRLAKSGHELTKEWLQGEKVSSQGFDPRDTHLRKTLLLTWQYMGFPRQLGQHTGGFVITRDQLSNLCPVLQARMENRTCIEWDKDDIDALGFLKVDVLALGMLTCIRKAFDLVRAHYGRHLTLANIPQDDPRVYEMISHADTLGVFQIESRAQMSMLPRLKPRTFYDLVIEVAIVRPGPIQGDMVHPYLKRRRGEEPVEYPSRELEEILGRTLGVPLFQEQAMEIAIVAAGFTPAEADGLRRSMATFKAHGLVSQYEKKLVGGMVARGYEEDFARRVFRQLEGFGSYGFPESHAASFALLVYVSCWLKYHYPDVFATALLNSQPMGFYRPAQIVNDARKHGVEVRPVDVNRSCWDHVFEEKSGQYLSIRLGFRQVKGLHEADMQLLVEQRKKPYVHITDLINAGVPKAALERLADADAFRSLGLDRRQALWDVLALQGRPIGVFTGQVQETPTEKKVVLPAIPPMEQVLRDYASTTLSLKSHPLSHVRERLDQLRVSPTVHLGKMKDGAFVKVCGLITVRQRPGTAKGVLFITIEDETGFANLVVWAKTFEKYRSVILQSRLLMVSGKLQVEGEVIHVVVRSCHNLNRLLKADPPGQSPAGKGKFGKKIPQSSSGEKGQQGELFPSRDFK